MGRTGQGMIELDLEKLWEFIKKEEKLQGEIHFGVPRTNPHNKTLEINYSFSEGYDDPVSPEDWGGPKPVSVLEWQASLRTPAVPDKKDGE